MLIYVKIRFFKRINDYQLKYLTQMIYDKGIGLHLSFAI